MSEQNKIDEIKAEYQMAEELFKRQPQMRDKFNQTHDWIGYLLQEIERIQGEVEFWKQAADNQKDNNMKLISVIHDKDEKAREAITIWETATPEDDFDDIMHAVIDELKDSLAL